MTRGEPTNPENYQPLPDYQLAGQTTAADMERTLRVARTHGIGRAFSPRWSGDGRGPTTRTHKPGAFRVPGQD